MITVLCFFRRVLGRDLTRLCVRPMLTYNHYQTLEAAAPDIARDLAHGWDLHWWAAERHLVRTEWYSDWEWIHDPALGTFTWNIIHREYVAQWNVIITELGAKRIKHK